LFSNTYYMQGCNIVLYFDVSNGFQGPESEK